MPNDEIASQENIVQETTIQENIDDAEILYRSIRQRREEIVFEAGGVLRVSPQAFADKNKQPSLYRHNLCDAPPHSNPPRMATDQAVVSLIAGKIRQKASPIEHKADKQGTITYIIDVKSDLSNNQHRSHAIVLADPDFKTNGAFEKLKIRLAQLVEDWAIQPDAAFMEQLRAENG